MNAEYLALCAATEVEELKPLAAGVPAGGLFGKIGEFLRAWRDAGLKVGDFWMWLPVILQLIQVIGPKIAEIIQAIRDAINNNVSPKAFDVTAAAASVG